jgi:MFS family permease
MPDKNNIWQVLRRREVVATCLFLFMTDLVIGAISPTLSLFARSLGASLTLVGVLATALGLARFGSSLVMGSLSDRRGRKNIMLVGMALMGLATLLYAVTTDPYMLLLVNALFGLSFVANLTVALAYIADLVTARERSLVFGVVTTAMGLGFSIGSFMGGWLVARWGYSVAYLAALAVAALALAVIWRSLPASAGSGQHSQTNGLSWGQQMGALLANPMIIAACLGTILANLIFGGLIVTFFPLYAQGFGLGQAAISSLFGLRTLASTLARLPAGILGARLPVHWVMLGALSLATGVALVLPQFAHPIGWMLLLSCEGVAFGLFLTAGQTAIAAQSDESNRGAVVGIYMAAAAVGDSFAPLFLGLIADRLGIISVFYVVGSLAVLGVISMAWILMRQQVALSKAGQKY